MRLSAVSLMFEVVFRNLGGADECAVGYLFES